MKPEQRRFLKERLNATRHMRAPTPKPPAAVVKARAVVDAWEQEQHEDYNMRRDAYNRHHREVMQIILFGTADAALAAVKRMEEAWRPE